MGRNGDIYIFFHGTGTAWSSFLGRNCIGEPASKQFSHSRTGSGGAAYLRFCVSAPLPPTCDPRFRLGSGVKGENEFESALGARRAA